MKQHHQLLQSPSGVALLRRINTTLLFFFLGCIPSAANDKPILSNQIDAVYVFSIEFESYFAVNVSKEEFISCYLRSSETHSVVINDSNKIEQLISYINTLQASAELNNRNSDIRFYYKPIVSKSAQLHLVNTYPLDIRCLIVIENSNKYTPIWLSNNYAEIEGIYYEIDGDLREWINALFCNAHIAD